MRKVSVLLLVVGLVAALSLPAAAATAGEDTYKAKCQMCHAADGKGTPPMVKSMGVKDLGSAEVQKMTDAELTAAIEKGKNKMTGFKGKLTDAQIADLVKYVRTFKK